MPGPNSTPNGDTTVARGHVNEKFVCNVHAAKQLDECERNIRVKEETSCRIVSLREYLAQRGRLTTGKTDAKRRA